MVRNLFARLERLEERHRTPALPIVTLTYKGGRRRVFSGSPPMQELIKAKDVEGEGLGQFLKGIVHPAKNRTIEELEKD